MARKGHESSLNPKGAEVSPAHQHWCAKTWKETKTEGRELSSDTSDIVNPSGTQWGMWFSKFEVPNQSSLKTQLSQALLSANRQLSTQFANRL